MTSGSLVTLWTVRAACVLYVFALAAGIARRPSEGRWLWTLGFACFLGHVLAAFAFHHHWSHRAAYEDTARQTAALFRIRSGAGLYFNYAFLAIWAADVVWMWWNAAGHRGRPRWIAIAIHVFMAFMFFNGAVVFASGWIRWFGIAAVCFFSLRSLLLSGRMAARKSRSWPHSPAIEEDL